MVNNKRALNKSAVKITDVPGSGIRILQFEDAAQPVFCERKGAPYIMYGEKNDYPNYLLYLYNNSAKHSAIINGKVDYVIGKGWDYEKESVQDDQKKLLDQFISTANAKGESLKSICMKLQLDIEIFNGAYINVIWNSLGQIASIYHIDYTKVRSNKDNTEFYVSDEWVKYNKDGSWRPVYNPEYDTYKAYNENNKIDSQILYIKQYHPGIDIYTLPNYRGSITWIEVDVEIGVYHLNNVKGGFFANKMINFNNGVPPQEGQEAIEKMLTKKFAGTRGRRFMVTFNNDATRAPTVNDLNVSESDKLFDQLNKTGQQEIFTGHRVTSPILFGIKTEGQLGGRTEIRESYSIFQNTYVNGRQQCLEEVINCIAAQRGIDVPMTIIPTEPISFEFSEAIQAQNMSKDEIREKMGLPTSESEDDESTQEIITAIGNLPPSLQTAVIGQLSPAQLLSLVGLQYVPAATPVTQPTPVQAHKFSHEEDEEDNKMFDLFSKIGTPRAENFIIKSKKIRFLSSQDEAKHFASEENAMTKIQQGIIELLNKDPLVTMQVMSDSLNVDIDTIAAAVADLNDRGIINISDKVVDGDTVAERKPIKDAINKVSTGSPITKSISVKYSYDGPEDSRNRPFCAKMLQLDRLYTRKEIEQLSGHLGYSVWARRGGWYGKRPFCRHWWTSHVVVSQSN